MSVTGHVQSGSRNKGSQFISTTTDINTAKDWANKTGNRIVEIDLNSLPQGTRVYDLSTETGRDEYLNNKRSKSYAGASSEVLITDEVPKNGVTLWEEDNKENGDEGTCS